MGPPVRIAELVGDELVGSLGIGHPEEGLGEAQQRNAFGRVEAIFLKELVHPA
jgi:hypothetical protein